MALVAMRSANEPGSPQCCNSDKEEEDEDAMNKNGKSDFFFFNNGAPLDYSLRDAQQPNAERRLSINSSRSTNSIQSNNSDIQQHLQSMFYLLRHEETLKMAVKLESQHENRTRYLVIASRYCQRPAAMDRKHRTAKSNTSASSRMLISSSASQTSNDKNSNKLQHHQQSCDSIETKETVQTSRITNTQNVVEEAIEESCLLGIDCNDCTTLGLVVPILADTTIRLDGDGGFSVKVYDKTYIFKPVSVQAMWSALQTLHKVSQKARENNFYFSGPSHDWLSYYESNIESDQSCLNEWHAMDSLESRRPPSPDAIRNKPTAKEETESIIKMKLKEIMMSVDLDEVTSKYIRSRLEEQLDMDLDEFKEFIDIEMLTILGQMDAPTEIFEHVYLGSEWNASNLEELQKNGVRHILNVTREIDNFFPGMFDYFNVRVYDDEKTNLLKHWDNTFRYITRAKAEGSKVLVHCKMGVSRSASVVIAYAMKAYNWEFQQALQHVKGRRSCIKPNKNFLNQLETYRGMLDAMKNKEKLQRSKSETNLKCTKDGRLLPGSEPTPLIQALNQSKSKSAGYEISSRDSTESRENVNAESNVTNPLELNKGVDKENSSDACAKLTRLRRYMRRSSSSSPKTIQRQSTSILAMSVLKQQSQSLENLTPERSVVDEPKNMRFPGSNGENYSVTQNQVLHIQKNTPPALAARLKTPQSVRTIIHGLESHHNVERKSMKLPFTRSVSHDAAECAESKSAIRAVHDELIGKSEKTETDETDKKHSFNRRTQQFRALHPALNIKLPIDEGSCVETTPSTTTTTTTKIGDNSFNESENKISQRYDLLPSRHASWGSGDTRGPCLPRMRNSSWSDTNRNNNTIFTHNASAASYKNQTNIGVDDHTELMTMRYKTAPIPFFEATLNNTDSNHITTGSSVKRTTLILERHKNRAEYQNDINAIQQDVSQRRKHLYRSSSAVGTTNHHTSNTNQNNTLSTRISDIPSYTMSDIANKNMSAYQSIIVDDDEVALRVGAGVGGGVGATNCTFDEQRISSGNVKVLKRNFEAKAKTKFAENAAYFVTNTTTTNPAVVSSTVGGNTSRKLHHSLPSSPVAQHIDYNIQPMNKYENTDILESSSSINSRTIPVDAGVKGLVHKYQTTATSACGNPLLFSSNVNNTPLTNFKPRPRSYYDVSHKNIQIDNNTAVSSMNPLQHEYNENRPPPVPIKERTEETQMQMQMQIQPKQSQRQNQSTSAVNTCTLSHKRLRQHGKTHPLSRLSLPKEHFNTAAYNTM